MKDIKNINNKINKFLEDKKEEKERLNKLDEALKKRTQAHYICEVKKAKKTTKQRKKIDKNTAFSKVVNLFNTIKLKLNHKEEEKTNPTLINKVLNFKWSFTLPGKGDHPIKLRNGNPGAVEFSSTYYKGWSHGILCNRIKTIQERIKKPISAISYKSIKEINIFKKLKFQTHSIQLLEKFSSKKRIQILSATAIGIVTLIFSSVYAINNIAAYELTIYGEEIGIVKDPESVLFLIDLIDEKLDIAYNADIYIDKENIQFDKIRGFDLDILTDDEILNRFTYFANLEAVGYALYVNNKEVATFSRKEITDKLLEDIKDVYIEEDRAYEEVSFLENVTIKEVNTTISNLDNYDATLSYILKGTTEEKIHKVKKGENYWTIAEKYNITPEELEAANPTVKPERLQIGQDISLIVPKPLITVASIEKVTYHEKIPYEVTYENTSAMFKGEKEVKLSGKNGKKEILAEVEKHNGIEVNRTELEAKVIEEPRTQIVLVGTKNPPPLIGTGSFNNPTRGRLTSKYGMRWGRMHTGIDIAASTGTPIRASDGGVVTYTGWKGNYGLTVIVDHGKNRSTLYAHCSKVLVKKGQKVFQGQKIAEVGNTGRSTGPHVHFEVLINGKTQNPLNYVKY